MRNHWRLFIVAIVLVMTLALSGGAEAASKSWEAWHVVSRPSQGGLPRVLAGVVQESQGYVAVGATANPNDTLVEQWNGSSWNVVPSPSGGSVYNFLGGVRAVSATNIWAVGSYSNDGSTGHTLVEHWNGTKWKIVPSPSPGSVYNFLSAVTVISATNIWAVGAYGNSSNTFQTLVEHWNGTKWSVVPSPGPGSSFNTLSGVTAVSATNIWAVGSYINSTGIYQTLVEHWNGTQWSIVPSPSPGSSFNFLGGVTAVLAKNIWAVGAFSNNGSTSQTLVEHWNGTKWSIVSSPSGGSSSNPLSAVAAVSANDIWAVGTSTNGPGKGQTLIELWNGSIWSIVPSPNAGSADNYLSGVAAASANDAWAVGSFSNNGSNYQTLTEHWNGTQWSVVPSP